MKGVTEPIELLCSCCGRSERFASYGQANAKAGWIIRQDGSVLCGQCRWAREHGLRTIRHGEQRSAATTNEEGQVQSESAPAG